MKTSNSLTAYQLASSFPDEVREYAPKQIQRLERILTPLKQEIVDIQQSDNEEAAKIIAISYTIEASGLKNEINYLETLKKAIKMLTTQNNKGRITTSEINKARNFPIIELYSFNNLKKKGNRYFASCPFHGTDSNPSFVVYETNKFHCFGCQAHGSSIDFYMKLNSCDFKTAVTNLLK